MLKTTIVAMRPLIFQSSFKSSCTQGRVLQQVRGLRLQATQKRMSPVPGEEHSAHTISQRIRTLKKIPPELIPLGIVLAVAIAAAGYSLGKQLVKDKTLRLKRTGKKAQPEH